MPVNGEPRDEIAISDRGLAYGDGVFETIRLEQHRPILFDEHITRLLQGTSRLRIALDRELLTREIDRLAPDFPAQGILKIVITRGTGGRGYRPGATSTPTRILSLHELPDYSDRKPEQGIDVFLCAQRLARQPALAGIKHLNRLEQVLASLEWPDPAFMEGLMLDTAGLVIEGTRSNLFWTESGQLKTPSLAQCGVAGTLRNFLLTQIPGAEASEDCTLGRLYLAEEVFFCNSIVGVWPVKRIQAGDTVTEFDPRNRRFGVMAAGLFAGLLAAAGK